MDYMLEEPEEPIRRRRDEEEPDDDWSDEEADRAEDRWIAERDNLYR